MKTVIIGGVAGGATAATRLRRLDENMEIIILERGQHISYANCGLPYYIGDVIKERDALLLMTPQAMKDKYNLDVRIESEVTSIDPEGKKVTVRKGNGEVYEESYDHLLIATGSTPLRPPIKGIDGEGIYTLWTVPDTDRIRGIVDEQKPKRAAVIGGGFIGLEMAENLAARGIHVTIIEALDQVMAPVDFDMAQLLHENIEMNGVDLILGDGVDYFEEKDGGTAIHLKSGKAVDADMVILSIGVRPNSAIAKEAGIQLNERGGIKVDKYLRTSKPDIYAVGDVIQIENFVTKEPGMIPLAGPANKQARIIANNIFAITQGKEPEEPYEGTLGTSVAQVFDLTVAAVGINEKVLKAMGKEENKDYYIALINQKSHAGYYPGATPLTLKMLFDKSGKIFGAQIVGQDGVDKRIDVLATTMRLGGTIWDLEKLELAYAPPYSSAKDPVNMLGNVAGNIIKGNATFVQWKDIKDDDFVLDVSEDVERMVFSIPGSHHIPLSQLRDRQDEIPKDKCVVPYCSIGVRSYNAARMLCQTGCDPVKVAAGGTSFYKSNNYEQKKEDDTEKGSGDDQPGAQQAPPMTKDLKILDCTGLQCPGPIMKVNEAIKNMEDGEILRVSATDMGFARDVESWAGRTGNTFISAERSGKENVVTLQKGTGANAVPVEKAEEPATGALPQGKSMIVFDGDMDKVLASFIIANGAAAMGRPVTMFFTFWGLNAIRKPENLRIKKPFVEKMFEKMMPRGAGKLKLSNMNMAGMGSKMMKGVMKKKNVASLEELIQQAMDSGVRLVACTMSMDVMGITKEELIDGVELAGVASYLADAEMSNVNLFI
ncbi:MAG: FAD-dependent oxidoreductase [Anaerovoracaceae bacterium]|jgi:NADPH-dependent 2,4-dienoyl-CoA reductase/sulfur reductase-like enzyme/peroxiredoxin family protein/TusA-related sulfurtransferase/rhodanese-related sulfurtransferase